MLDGERAKKMQRWMGFLECGCEGDTNLLLWYVCERLEREGWSFNAVHNGFSAMRMTHQDNNSTTMFREVFPTKSDAVCAAFDRETGASK